MTDHVKLDLAYRPHDAGAAPAARQLIEWITELDPRLRVEHVGSTAVPGCGGKGVIDLMVAYPYGLLDDAKRVLADLGFQPQQSRDPFPESRPMRVGTVAHGGTPYPIHAHVVAASSLEAEEMIRFRDLLRADPGLQRAYEAEKRRILADGVRDGLDYARRKGGFVRRLLERPDSPTPGGTN